MKPCYMTRCMVLVTTDRPLLQRHSLHSLQGVRPCLEPFTLMVAPLGSVVRPLARTPVRSDQGHTGDLTSPHYMEGESLHPMQLHCGRDWGSGLQLRNSRDLIQPVT